LQQLFKTDKKMSEQKFSLITEKAQTKHVSIAINERYTQLSNTSCCLSCGGAINHAKPQIGEICVDLGSGRGNDVIRLAEETGETGYVYGIDISEGMIAKAKANLEKFEVNNAEIIKADLENLPLKRKHSRSGYFKLYYQPC
jgi:tRNA G46 methylase TrmB